MTNSSADELTKHVQSCESNVSIEIKKNLVGSLFKKTLFWHQLKNRSLFESPAREAIFWA
jgi:hypothetical protein